MKLCECGCGRLVKNRFVRGHQIRIKNPMWDPEIAKKMRETRKRRIKGGLIKIWSKGLTGDEYLSHFEGGKTWNDGLTKGDDERLSRAGEKLSAYLIENGIYSGKNNPFYGKKHTEETIKKIRKTLEESGANKRASERMKTSHPLDDLEVYERYLKTMNSEEYKQKKREWIIDAYKEGKFNIRPNGPEKRLIRLFKGEGLLFKYVGDGSFWVGDINPDFIHTEDMKKVIEVFGDYWHRDEDPQDRIDAFSEHGWDCMVIWEHELMNKGLVIKNIMEFLEE